MKDGIHAIEDGGGEDSRAVGDTASRRRGQQTLHSYYPMVSREESERSRRQEYRAQERRMKRRRRQGSARREIGSRPQHRQDRTMGITTQNVRGLATHMTKLATKLHGFKEQHMRGNRDIILLQETHLNPGEHEAAGRQYCAMWGFKHTQASTLAFWSSGERRKAGVAILVNPYGAVKNMRPWREEEWNEHVMMTEGEADGRRIIFVNVYAPTHGASRVNFFAKLAELPFPEGVERICGGDFNCVLDGCNDRHGTNKQRDMGSRELQRFIEKFGLVDAGNQLKPEGLDEAARAQYATDTHTHFHETGEGRRGSARLDRFYIGVLAAKYLRGVVTEEPLCRTDHRAVLLELHPPDGPLRMKKRPKLYPPPAYVSAATASLNQQMLRQLAGTVDKATADTTLKEWAQFKVAISAQMTALKKAARERMTGGYRQKIKRLKHKLRMKELNADSTDTRAELLEELQQLQEGRRTLRRRALLSKSEWSARATTKDFYRRICTKFGDNTIKRLVPKTGTTPRREDDKANILRDAWEEILNGVVDDSENRDAFIERCQRTWVKVDLTELDEEIDELEVRAAIQACKPGKSCGPDDLGNAWYRDHCELLVPVLTKLFNSCMEEGHTPRSFLEAYIFSIGKGGDRANPLNYRPIALLNTDYKIFTRILAWRVRRFVDRLVNHRQCGFVPGRTIHEVIDLMEAAKEQCRRGGDLSSAQVLMLDFAKAYDSLDRAFLMAVLKAKGFPPKILAIIQAIHDNTTVRFMANGFTSEPMQVTSGIRQGCPLAPLLFIIAVDLLYDAIEADVELEGIDIGPVGSVKQLKVAGYADDTAIYIAKRRMQAAALRAVQAFSAVSGLRLNVKKSAAINLAHGGVAGEQVADASTAGKSETEGGQVAEIESVRYLGHIAGAGDTTTEAWTKAMEALRVRLTLAETKTNTAQQRAAIAGAIIVPKLLYVARHAWPTEALAKNADRAIRNYVWGAEFRVPDQVKAGWISKQLAELALHKGGIGVPNLYTELKAMSAMTVGEWALSTRPQMQAVGDILQRRDRGDASPLVPYWNRPVRGLRKTLWATGRPWVELYFAEECADKQDAEMERQKLRRVLRHSHGTTTTWTQRGLRIVCEGRAREVAIALKRKRRTELGECAVNSIKDIQLRSIWVGDAQGEELDRKRFNRLHTTGTKTMIGQVMTITFEAAGAVVFKPTTQRLPMQSGDAHCFRELCLNLIANFPELIGKQPEGQILHVKHGGEDPHHVFEVGSSEPRGITHTWGSLTAEVEWRKHEEHIEAAVARSLTMEAASITVMPHPQLMRMQPLWIGKRRWKQSRRKYKQIMNKQRDSDGVLQGAKIEAALAADNEDLASALKKLTWKRIYKMEGVSAYQTQNIYKLKQNRLRMWAGQADGFGCQASGCLSGGEGGTVHMVWGCSEARRFWAELRRRWGLTAERGDDGDRVKIQEIFGCRLQQMPTWIVSWAKQARFEPWADVQQVVTELWAIGVAVTITALWRMNVDRVHEDGDRATTVQEALMKWGGAVREAYARYKLRLYPVTQSSVSRIQVAELIGNHWAADEGSLVDKEKGGPLRIGFFDGGSRGNPGPGGSGSVVVQRHGPSEDWRPVWAAATALGHARTTNNVAEFVGLHRLLLQAAKQGWRDIHIVGDSAMILRLMKNRTTPKARKLRHWYFQTARLADICGVSSWEHHYRRSNKMADWLANQAMDSKQSIMEVFDGQGRTRRLYAGIEERLAGDVKQWMESKETEET